MDNEYKSIRLQNLEQKNLSSCAPTVQHNIPCSQFIADCNYDSTKKYKLFQIGWYCWCFGGKFCREDLTWPLCALTQYHMVQEIKLHRKTIYTSNGETVASMTTLVFHVCMPHMQLMRCPWICFISHTWDFMKRITMRTVSLKNLLTQVQSDHFLMKVRVFKDDRLLGHYNNSDMMKKTQSEIIPTWKTDSSNICAWEMLIWNLSVSKSWWIFDAWKDSCHDREHDKPTIWRTYTHSICNISTEKYNFRKIWQGHNLSDNSIANVPFDSHHDGYELGLALDMSWEEVRKSILTDLNDFLSNKGVGNVMVIEYNEKRKQLHSNMMMKL